MVAMNLPASENISQDGCNPQQNPSETDWSPHPFKMLRQTKSGGSSTRNDVVAENTDVVSYSNISSEDGRKMRFLSLFASDFNAFDRERRLAALFSGRKSDVTTVSTIIMSV
jgi:hypothetical protein